MKRFLEFGKELKRPFEVSEHCYDCADFYDGCEAWPAGKPFACVCYNRLPDVMPATCGQKFPETRQRNERPAERKQDPVPAQQKRRPQARRPKGEPRLCECGATLPKGKRLCDTCRTQNRRQTRRGYMRGYMKQRRSPAVDSGSGVPFPAA